MPKLTSVDVSSCVNLTNLQIYNCKLFTYINITDQLINLQTLQLNNLPKLMKLAINILNFPNLRTLRLDPTLSVVSCFVKLQLICDQNNKS